MPRRSPVKHTTTWWRSPVAIQNGLVVPLGPFTPYDPFEFYSPLERATREQRSLPYQFLSVDGRDEQQVADFCSRYGMLGQQIQRFENWPDSSGLNADLLHLLTMPDRDRNAYLNALEQHVKFHALATEPCAVEDFRTSQEIMRRIVRLIQSGSRLPPGDRRLLEHALDRKTGRAKPHLVWDDDRREWRAGWRIDSLETVLYLMLLFDLLGGGQIVTCPVCGSTVLAERTRTAFCSERCQNRNKVRRHRRVTDYAEHRGTTRERARAFLRRIGIDPSQPFDFAKADLKWRKLYGTKRRQRSRHR